MMESLPVEMRRMIMAHFSNAELLTISLVTKQFKYEARSLMSARGIVNAYLGGSCQNVDPFLSYLQATDLIPFSGVKINWPSEELCKQCTLNSPNLDILDRVLWKNLSAIMHFKRNPPEKCPKLQFVQRMLTHFCDDLEELELNDNSKLLEFIAKIIQESKFPRLKTFKFVGTISYDSEEDFVKNMVARAPYLREIHIKDRPSLIEDLLQGSSASLVSTALYELSDGFTETVKLQDMNLYYKESFSITRFNRTVPRTLRLSSDTLRSIEINLIFLVPLMHSGVCLKKLIDFRSYLDYARWVLMDPRIFSLLKQFDFTRVFPKLNKVSVSLDRCHDRISADHMSEFVEQGIAARGQEPAPDRAVNIRHVSFSECLTAKAVPFLAEMFPHVKTLEVKVRGGGQQAPYRLIWKHWPELRELQVEKASSYTESTRNENLDSAFCGIFPSELARLKKQDEEYLRAVHIVPVMPSMTCLRGLRTLRVVRRHHNPHEILYGNIDPMFSKVTALIAFKRCPDLFVNIRTNSQEIFEAIDHLTPYTAVELVD